MTTRRVTVACVVASCAMLLELQPRSLARAQVPSNADWSVCLRYDNVPQGGCSLCYVMIGSTTLSSHYVPAGCVGGPPPDQPTYELFSRRSGTAGAPGGDPNWKSHGISPAYVAGGLALARIVLSHLSGSGGYAHLNEQIAGPLEQVRNDLRQRAMDIRGAAATDKQALVVALPQLVQRISTDTSLITPKVDRAAKALADAEAVLATTPPVPPQLSFNGALVEQFLESQDIAGQLKLSIPKTTLRGSGLSLLGALEPVRRDQFGGEGSAAETGRELEKHRAHTWNGTDLEAYAQQALEGARSLGNTSSPQGRRFRDALTRSARSARYRDDDLLPNICVPVSTGASSNVVCAANVGNLPSDHLAARIAEVSAQGAMAHARVAQGVKELKLLPPTDTRQHRAAFSIVAALRLAKAGDAAYLDGDLALAEERYRSAVDFMNIVLDLAPGLGQGKALYEFLSGDSIITGDKLQDPERIGALLGLVPLGVGKALGRTFESIRDLSARVVSPLVRQSIDWMIEAAETFLRHVEDVNPYLAVEKIKQSSAVVQTFHGLVGTGRISAAQFTAVEQRIVTLGLIGPQLGSHYAVPVLRAAAQAPHLPGTAAFGKSIWTNANPQAAVLDKFGTGRFVSESRELVEFDTVIGTVVDGTTGQALGPTQAAIIHYSRNGGVHIVPEFASNFK